MVFFPLDFVLRGSPAAEYVLYALTENPCAALPSEKNPHL